jgi:hypothetical protein
MREEVTAPAEVAFGGAGNLSRALIPVPVVIHTMVTVGVNR